MDRKRKNYDDMERPDRANPGRARGRSTRPQEERERLSTESISQYGSSSSSASRRPGEPSQSRSHQPGPMSAEPSSRENYPAPAGRAFAVSRDQRAQSALSEAASDNGSAASSAQDSTTTGRGAMRGRRILPADIITRPRSLVSKQGAFGKSIKLQSNYFKLLSMTDWRLYQYRVDVAPEEDRTFVRKSLLRSCESQIGAYIFDGSMLFTTQRLPDPLVLHAERREDNLPMTLTIKQVGDINKGEYQYLQVFNILMRRCLEYLDLKLVGRNYFDPQAKVRVTEYKFELWPGYESSIRQHENDILMCAEITNKVMRDQTLYDILVECHNKARDWQAAFKSEVLGIVVLTDYNNNTYRIDDVDFGLTPESTFKKRTGEEISYMEYYQTRYQLRIRDARQPMLVSKPKERDRRGGKTEMVLLVPELCRTTGLTDSMRTNFRLMQALAQYTRVAPSERINKLMRFNQRLQQTPKIIEQFTEWNLTLDNKLVDVPGRILPPETIIYANKSSVVPYNANWQNDFRNAVMKNTATLKDWALVTPKRLKQDCQSFVRNLQRAAKGMNFSIEEPFVYELDRDDPREYVEMLERIKAQSNPMLIFCAAMNNRADRYSAIKKKCCVDRPVPTQVVLAKNLNAKSVMSIATKVAIQMNCKVGGHPWSVSIPLAGLMVVGFDVCHAKGGGKNNSYGALVASLDRDYGRYFSAISAHTNGEELSSNLSVNLAKALQEFRKYNDSFPKKIVIYRDGVGDGQVNYVVSHELKSVKDKLAGLYGGEEHVKLGFIIVTKRINTRLFYQGKNPEPGTVVDNVITDPTKFDFFIVSQHVGQGTVTPTSYNVIEDSLGMDVDKIQRLTYKMCHMYFNWSGTVRVPAPCQYAHKLAFLVSQSIGQAPPSNILENILYFL